MISPEAKKQQGNASKLSGLSLNLMPLVLVVLFFAIFAGCQGGRYYLANRLQEVGIASALILFVFGAWQGMFQLHKKEWKRWVLVPMAMIFGIMIISAIVFKINYNGNIFYSFFSAREFMLGFVGPGIFLLCRCGLPVSWVERTIAFSILALMINYLFFYNTMDLKAAFFSSDHTVSNLVTYDEWRGFRLKPPLFAIMVGLLSGIIMLFKPRSLSSFFVALVFIGLAGYIWSIVQFRSTLASMLFAILLYPLLLSRRNRLNLIIVLAPLVVLAMPLIAHFAINYFMNAEGGGIRVKAFMLAFEHIPQHFLFGAGEDSAYGDSYQDLVAPYFYPSDLGLVGTFYKYGLIGTLLYLYMHGKIWFALWRANLIDAEQSKSSNPLLWGLLIFMTAQTFNLVLNPGLAYAQGITLGAVALSLSCVHLSQVAQKST